MSNTTAQRQPHTTSLWHQITAVVKAGISFSADQLHSPFVSQPFLSLPRELRDQIYHYYFEEILVTFRSSSRPRQFLIYYHARIFFVNRQIYREATLIFYKHYFPQIPFQFYGSKSIARFFGRVGAHHLGFKGQLRIVYIHEELDWNAIFRLLVEIKKIAGWGSTVTIKEVLKENNDFQDAMHHQGPGLKGKAWYLCGEDWQVEVRFANDGSMECLQLDGDIGHLRPLWEVRSMRSALDCRLSDRPRTQSEP
jgi:hypothetical protein